MGVQERVIIEGALRNRARVISKRSLSFSDRPESLLRRRARWYLVSRSNVPAESDSHGTGRAIVALPADAAQVAGVLRLSTRHRFPLGPRGAGTGLSDGFLVLRDIIVLRTERMNRVLKISLDDPVCVVADVGDRNLHPAFWRPVPAGGCPDAYPQRLFDAVGEMVVTAVEHGGTSSGEHSIGVAKRRWLKAEISPASSALQHNGGQGAPVRG